MSLRWTDGLHDLVGNLPGHTRLAGDLIGVGLAQAPDVAIFLDDVLHAARADPRHLLQHEGEPLPLQHQTDAMAAMRVVAPLRKVVEEPEPVAVPPTIRAGARNLPRVLAEVGSIAFRAAARPAALAPPARTRWLRLVGAARSLPGRTLLTRGR